MRRPTRTLVLAALVATAAVGLGRSLRPTAPRPHARAALVALPRECGDFGEAWEDQQFTWVLPISNPTPEVVRVTDIRASCNCVGVEPRALTLPPGGRGEIKLVLDLSPRPHERSGTTRRFEAEVAFRTATDIIPHATERVTIKGTVRPVLDVRPRDPSFGTRSDRVQPPLPTSFTVMPNTPLETLTAVCDTPGFAAAVRDTGADTLTVTVTPTRPIPPGPFAAEVRLVPVRPGGAALPERRVEVLGEVAADLTSDPPQVTFGGRAVGDAAEESVTLRSLTGRQVEAHSVKPRGDGVTAELTPEGAVRVRLEAVREGELRGRIDVVVRAGDDAPATVSVPVVGYGTARAHQGGRP